MIKAFVLNNYQRKQIITVKNNFEYLHLISYYHNLENQSDYSYFTINWPIIESGKKISQYFNFFIQSAPIASNHERRDVFRMLRTYYKEDAPFTQIELKLQRSFLSDGSSLYVTLDLPD